MPFFTIKPFFKLPLAALLPALFGASCGPEAENATASCVPGRTEACACSNGRLGAQQCLASGSFGACECSSSTSPDAGAAGNTSVDGGAKTEGGDDVSPAVREFCARTIGAFAENAASCCSEADRASSLFAGMDGDRRAMAAECEPLIGNALAAGRIRFDPKLAASCGATLAAKIENLPCSSPEVRAPSYWDMAACDGVIVGLQDIDQPCRRPSECRPGLACVGYDESKDGACRALPGGRDNCTRTHADMMAFPFDAVRPQCAPNLLCTQRSDDNSPKCHPLKDVGELCSASARDCKPGLECSNSLCVPYAAVGETCASFLSCGSGFTCDANKRCAEGVDGTPCMFDAECKGRCEPTSKKCRAFCGSR